MGDCHIDVPFLVTPDEISHPIISSNYWQRANQKVSWLKYFNQWQIWTTSSKLCKDTKSVWSRRWKCHIRGGDVILEAAKITHAPFKVDVGCLEDRIPMIFSSVRYQYHKGLAVWIHTAVMLRKGANNYDEIPLTKQC